MSFNEIFKGVGVEITFKEYEDFLKIKETLTRMGIASRANNTLYQSCHILHKQGLYGILHFKELFKLDGKETNFTEEDIERRNRIASLLAEWNLLKVVSPKSIEAMCPIKHIKIVSHKDKGNWTFVSKYQIGGKSEKISGNSYLSRT